MSGTVSEAKSSKPSAGTRADYRVFRKITTRWSDNDMYGHVNNAIQYFYFDTAINEWLIEGGCLDLHHGKQIGLVVQTGCNYYGQIAFPEVLDVGIRVAKVGTSSVRYEIGIFRAGSETAASEGFFIHVYVDRESHRPEPINADLRALLASAE